MDSARQRRRWGPWRIGLLAAAALLLLALGALAIKVTTPPAPFPIPPDLALAYPQDKFDSPDNARQIYERFSDETRAAQRSLPMGDLDPAELKWQGIEPAAWSPHDVELARRWVKAYQPALAVFREATSKPYFLEAQDDLTLLLPHIGRAVQLGRASVYEADLAFRDGNETGAVDALIPMLKAAAQLTQYGPTISRLTGNALEALAYRSVTRYLSDGSLRKSELLKRLADALATLERDRFPLADTFRIDYSGLHHSLEAWARGSDEGGLSLFYGEGGRQEEVRIWLELHLFYPRSLRNIQEHFRRRIAAMESNSPLALKDEIAERSAPTPPPKDFLSGMMMPVMPGLLAREAMTNAERHAMMVAIAAARYRLAHGAYPTSAAALVPEFLPALPTDPFDGQPIRTRCDGDAFVIWCIGLDFKDDGGAVAIPRKDWMNPNDRTNPNQPGDLVWRLEGRKR